MDASILGQLSPDMIIDAIDFGPDILNLVYIELQSKKIPYKQIAAKINVAAGTVGSWLSRGGIPGDKIWPVVQAVGSARLWMQVLSILPGNAFKMDYLDQLDDNPQSITDDVLEVAQAFIELEPRVGKIKRHKAKGYQFTDEEDAVLRKFEDVKADLILMAQMSMVKDEEYFGRSVRLIVDRQAIRMKECGYRSSAKKKSPVREYRRLSRAKQNIY